MLKLLLERETQRQGVARIEVATEEQTTASILRKLAAMDRARVRAAAAEAEARAGGETVEPAAKAP